MIVNYHSLITQQHHCCLLISPSFTNRRSSPFVKSPYIIFHSGFIDTFQDNYSFEVIQSNKKWSEADGRKALNSLKEFLDNLQVISLTSPPANISHKLSSELPYKSPRSHTNLHTNLRALIQFLSLIHGNTDGIV